jgi:hypothetical protein
MATDAERAALVLRIRTLSGGSKSELADHIEADGVELARLAAENKGLKDWQRTILNAPGDARARGVERMADSEALAPIVGAWRERVNALEAALRELLNAVDDLSVKLVHARPQVFITERLAEATERARALLPEGKP